VNPHLPSGCCCDYWHPLAVPHPTSSHCQRLSDPPQSGAAGRGGGPRGIPAQQGHPSPEIALCSGFHLRGGCISALPRPSLRRDGECGPSYVFFSGRGVWPPFPGGAAAFPRKACCPLRPGEGEVSAGRQEPAQRGWG